MEFAKNEFLQCKCVSLGRCIEKNDRSLLIYTSTALPYRRFVLEIPNGSLTLG